MPVKYLVFNIAVMEELTLTTPSILFSAISLIMLAYTNRFLAYAQVIRNLKGEHENRPSAMTKLQLDNLRKRLYMARSMQIYYFAWFVPFLSISVYKLWPFTRSGWLCCCW